MMFFKPKRKSDVHWKRSHIGNDSFPFTSQFSIYKILNSKICGDYSIPYLKLIYTKLSIKIPSHKSVSNVYNKICQKSNSPN